jgi:hypothetical protein
VVRSGAGHAQGRRARRLGGGSGARGSDVRERRGRKKGQARVLYPLMFVGLTHQPMMISGLVSYPVFMPKLSTHRMHDPGSNVPHIQPKVLTDNQMS